MSTELKSSGEIVGSQRYFFTINSKYFISKLMTSSAGCDYKSATDRICKYISDVVAEIYSDLDKHSRSVRYTNSTDIANMQKFINGLCEVATNYGNIGGRYNNCFSILNGTAYNAKQHSRATNTEIENAVKKIKNNNYLSTTNSVDLINKLINNGVRSISATENNTNFLIDILGKYDEDDFLKDVMLKYNFEKNPKNYTGKNGKQICTKEYIAELEKRIFYTELSKEYSMSNNPYVFKMFIDNAFIGILNQIESDLKVGVSQNDYIKHENAEKISDALKSLDSVNVKYFNLDGLIKQLDWFVDIDAQKVKDLQLSLNNLRNYNLLEDGVYGAKTSENASLFLNTLTGIIGPSIESINNPLKTSRIFSSRNISYTSYSSTATSVTNSIKILSYVLSTLEALEVIANDLFDGTFNLEKQSIIKLSRIVGELIGGLGGAAIGGSLGASAGSTIGAFTGVVTANPVIGVGGYLVGGFAGGAAGGIVGGNIGAEIGGSVFEEIAEKIYEAFS